MDHDELVAVLKERGIELNLAGCGCCGSPWLEVKVDGKSVYETDHATFTFDES